MPGKNPTVAFYAFAGPLQQNIQCLTHDQLVTTPGGRHQTHKIHSLTLSNGPILLTGEGVHLHVGLQYSIVHTGKAGKAAYKVSTRAYAYTFMDADDRPVMAYHWHPFGNSAFAEPHFHPYSIVGGLPPKAHHPSSRVSLESVIRFCIEQLGAPPTRDDWDRVLTLNEGKFLLYRSWSDASQMPKPQA